MTAIALVISIIGLILSLVFVGIVPSIVSLIMGIKLFIEERTIPNVRVIAISTVGILLPLIMYFNTYGFSFSGFVSDTSNPVARIVRTNYENLGLIKGEQDVAGATEKTAPDVKSEDEQDVSTTDEDTVVYVSNKSVEDLNSQLEAMKQEENKETGDESIFESLDSIDDEDKNKGGVVSIAPSDDDMPSYGGLPVGTLLIAQYFREDDHNCNPVLVLQNKTGENIRYECRFIARNKEGDEMAVSDKTVEVVRDGALFVFEGRFDKKELGGGIPASYEFSITKRKPYEKDMADQISVYTKIEGSSAFLTAENKSNERVKVDAYVLFFDGKELVDCMWMIPQNNGEVCLEPGSSATIQGDAYYRFDRVETFYTAYEAVEGE